MTRPHQGHPSINKSALEAALLPCPFCGDPMELRHTIIRHTEFVADCPIAKMAVDHLYRDRWNRRSPAPAPAETEEDRALANFDKIKDSFFASNDAVLSASAKGVTDEMVEQALGEAGFPPTEFSRIWMGAALEAALALLPSEFAEKAGVVGWRDIENDPPPHDVPVLLWSPPSLGWPNGQIEARPFSTGRSGPGWSEYSQHSWATKWMPLPASPSPATGEA